MISSFLYLFFPKTCYACGQELESRLKFLCVHCLLELPLADIFSWTDNDLYKKLKYKSKIVGGLYFLNFRSQSVAQKITHEFKYNNNKEMAVYMGSLFGTHIYDKLDYKGIDFIIPIPLHPAKLRKRHYNQSERIAYGLSKKLNIPLLNKVLIRIKNTDTQTYKSKFQRWENMDKTFEIKNKDLLKGKTILLVDDVITTGATISKAIESLVAQNIKVKIAVLSNSSIL